jgi:hypothetical protein
VYINVKAESTSVSVDIFYRKLQSDIIERIYAMIDTLHEHRHASSLSLWREGMLDFTALRERKISYKDLCADLSVDDLHRLTDEMVDIIKALVTPAQDDDVVFQPVDPLAHDEFAATAEELTMPWTLGHVIVHTTASAEEAAARASSLARGVEVKDRSRYEVPWQSVATVEQLRQRLEESRRMRHAFLNAWPDIPNLELTFTADYPNAKPRNAVMMFVGGLAHEDAHLNQITEILRQATEPREEERRV